MLRAINRPEHLPLPELAPETNAFSLAHASDAVMKS
jgi:hypothetical protein